MSATASTPDKDFVVKEDAFLNYLIGGLCFAFFVLSLVGIFRQSSSYIDYFAIPFFLGPAIFFTHKGWKNSTVMVINTKGIFYLGKLVTTWEGFYNAYIQEEEKLGRISDNFVLVVKTFTDEAKVYKTRKIKLTNTQSKSEEAIVEAIKHFNKLSKERMIG